MIKIISGEEISGIKLDTPKQELSGQPVPEDLHIEFKNNYVSGISFRNADGFILDDQVIEKADFKKWIKQENPYVDGQDLVFKSQQIAAFGIEHPEDGYEITLYSKSVKDLYEKKIKEEYRYNDFNRQEEVSSIQEGINYIPFKGIGMLDFGDNIEKVKKVTGLPKNVGSKGNSIHFLYYPKQIFRFDNNGLSQITFINPDSFSIEGHNLMRKSELETFVSEQTVIERGKSYKIIPSKGIVLSFETNQDHPSEVIICNPTLMKFWENTKRPVTSW